MKSCSPSQCQTEVEEEKVVVSSSDDLTRESLNRVRDYVRDNVDQVRDNVDQVRDNVDQVRDNVDQVRDNVDQVRDNMRDYAVPFRGDVDRIRALCDNNNENVLTRSFEFETICKKYVPRNCDPDFDDCRPKEVCYKKPRLIRDASDDEIRVRCRDKR